MEELKLQILELQNCLREIQERGNGPVSSAANLEAPAIFLSSPNVPTPEAIDIHGDICQSVKFFKSSWEYYCIATNLSTRPMKQQTATLLSCIGKDCLKLFHNLPLRDEDRQSCDTILAALEAHLLPKINKRYERAIFNSAVQESGENIDQYIHRLRGLIKNCQYGDMQDELLLDRIVVSVKDVRLRQRLWENQEITLNEAIQKCRAAELTEIQMKQLNHDQKNIIEAPIDKIQSRTRRPTFQAPSNKSKCNYCGYEHARDKEKCPANGKKCLQCGLMNHFASVCRSKVEGRNDVKLIEDYYENILAVRNKLPTQLHVSLFFAVGKKCKKIKCQLDTGASCNVMGMS